MAAALLVWAPPVAAHASLVDATPAPGVSLPQSPDAVVLRFSEALERSGSSIRVTGPDGRDATTGPTSAVPDDARSMRRRLGLARPGRYDVRWTSVSRDDGHVERGRYSFAIGTASVAARSARGGAVPDEGVLGLLGQLVAVVGLTMWAGALLLGRPAVRAGLRPALLTRLRRACPALVVGGAAIKAVAAVARAPAQTGVVHAIATGRSGALGIVVLAAAGVVGLVAHRRPWPVACSCLVALTAQSAAGHAGSAAVPAVAVVVLVVHLIGAGVWLFAIATAAVVVRLRRALAILSRYAVASALAVAMTGVAGAALERVGPRELLTTSYGRTLVAKTGVFVLVVGLGAWHAYRRHLRAPRRRIKLPLLLEVSAAGLALIVATILAASPPPTTFARTSPDAAANAVLGDLDGDEALSIADATGPYVVGLTIAPAHAGRVSARVEIVPPGATDVAADVTLHALGPRGASFTVVPHAAGAGAFVGAGRIPADGNWSFGISFRARGTMHAVTLAAALPAPDGGGILAEALSAEERLSSVRLHETLQRQIGSSQQRTDYRFRAPDALAFAVDGVGRVDIGRQSFRQDRPGGPWRVDDAGAAFGWPLPYFRDAWAHATAVRVIGSDVIDGAPSHVVAFVRPDLPAWFELWVGDADGLVRREEMRAESHLMRHEYSGFNESAPIVAPA